MTTTSTPPRALTFRDRIRTWLGLGHLEYSIGELCALVSGLRADFDELGRVLNVRDLQVDRRNDGHDTAYAEQHKLVGQAVEQLNRVTGGFASMQDLLRHYERTVPAIRAAKRSYDVMVQREVRRRRALVEAHPELTEQARAHVMRTGVLPKETAVDAGQPLEPAAEPSAPTPAESPASTD